MRTAVISDIHANLEALTTVLGSIRSLNTDETVCLGDIVGYNANPNEVIELLREGNIAAVLGNHDACAAGLEEPMHFNPLARAAVLWTRERLTPENRQYLAGLPRERRVRDLFLFHGSIHDTNRYILERNDFVDNFRLLAGLPGQPSAGFFGHTHVQTALKEQQGIISTALAPEELELLPDKRYLLNPGSVGQPRDGDPRAAFLVYDDQARRVTFFRAEYDVRACQAKVLKAGLPPRLAERLAWGQ
jgi:predicted phosphodiesterase